ncbi:DUF2280 domain-containing protein [Rhizobium ruizarguesonis]|uniref:DUF2280 domain-containing protein n=1 Tax=Rhizobium ruizarguesonis TaxID=2081791 RepID=UPI000426BD5E|nr:DUF2280 domain-containing protein [Rhizobium ruizarguesonis]QJS27455.1 DUF2280 domain-containing protein [Rhizobium leguminosarum bv. trifolii TA1]UFW96209.1 DUF2280 domain-containing protein [Rhizobium ruizarguesonis]
MAKLNREQQTYAVQALACFDSPSVVAAALRKEFNVVLTPQSVESYDPTKKAGRNLAARWKALFEETRKTFLEDTASIAISHRAVRLRALQRMADKAETQGNMVLASSLLKQAAEEVGGSYTNRRELTGKDGKDLPVPVSPVTIFQLPDNGRS